MHPRRWWIIATALLLIPAALSFPAVTAASSHVAGPSDAPASFVVASTSSGLVGKVTNCTSTITCVYVFNTTKGIGWANSTVSAASIEQMALQLPGETKASYNLSYSTYIGSLIGTYTYWTVGHFIGTDVNTGHVVYGTTDTNYTITCHGHSGRGGGCTYTYTTDNGTIVVHSTKAEITSTSISCSSTSTVPGRKISCTVTVTNGWNASNYPTGNVSVSSGRTGPVSNKGVCHLTNGTCSFTYTPSDNTCGLVVLTAKYPGTSAYYRSSGTIAIDVVVSGGC